MYYIGLDLSTHTGYVKLNAAGEVIEAQEINEKCDSPESMWAMVKKIMTFVKKDPCIVGIENFGFSSQRGFQLGGIGWLVRVVLWKNNIPFHLVAPSQLKLFTGAKGNAKKDVLAVEIFERWGYKHPSDNVRDAFVLAQIVRYLHDENLKTIKEQRDVLNKIKNPVKNSKTKSGGKKK